MIDWVPVSERLPEEGGKYLVTNNLKPLSRYSIEIMSYINGFGFHIYDRDYGDIPMDDVIAWAMLPEPYREAEE